ncbi:hypothetical protein AMS62_18360 [Bacillus sp. FJAT-18019]|nr:hypothetical protein AMS62_18360 [Bacillus sp. FJAT-18019]
MKHKKWYPILLGIISLIIFGLVLSNGIQALFLLVDWPVSQFLYATPLILCIFVGLIQGICEEAGYYYVFSRHLKTWKGWKTPLLFGVGRSGLHLIFDISSIIAIGYSTNQILLSVVIVLVSNIGLFGLSIMDYTASRIHRFKWLCGLAIIIHTIMNGGLYAMEIGYISAGINVSNMFRVSMSLLAVVIAFIIYKKVKLDGDTKTI